MRILHIYNLNRVAQIYCDDLEQRGHSVAVCEPSVLGSHRRPLVKYALMIWRIFDLRRIVGYLNPKSFDLVHIHWATYGILGLVSQIPFVIHCHGSDVRYRLQHPFFRALLTPIFRRAAAVMCITPELVPIVQSIRPDAIFFPGPINTDQFTPCRPSPVQGSRPWTILLFTRLDPIKGPEIATQGIARFAQRYPEVRVQLLDWGTLKEHYKRRYDGRFEFIPVVSPDQVQNLLWSVDVVVGQCNLGILSLCELQAMSCAKPLICSSLYEEAYPTPTPLCNATTAEQIDAHLENLFQHPEIAMELGQREREWVVRYHSHRVLGAKLEALYPTFRRRIDEKNGSETRLVIRKKTGSTSERARVALGRRTRSNR